MNKKLLLVRHAEFDKVEEMNDFPGPMLNDIGLNQSILLSDYLNSYLLKFNIVTSDFIRCIQTIQPFIVSQKSVALTEPILRERNPLKEPHLSLDKRVKEWFRFNLSNLVKSDTIIVSHCGPINMILEEINENHKSISYTYEDSFLCHTPKAGIWEIDIINNKMSTVQLKTFPYTIIE